jgi:hypothetical protein
MTDINIAALCVEDIVRRACKPRKGDTYGGGERKLVVLIVTRNTVYCRYYEGRKTVCKFAAKRVEWATLVTQTLKHGHMFVPAKSKRAG